MTQMKNGFDYQTQFKYSAPRMKSKNFFLSRIELKGETNFTFKKEIILKVKKHLCIWMKNSYSIVLKIEIWIMFCHGKSS